MTSPLLCLIGLFGAATLLAPLQAIPDAAQVELVAARYAKKLYPKLSLALDPAGQEFATPHSPTGPLKVDYRTPEYLSTLARALDAVLVGEIRPALCKAEPAPGCVHAVVRIGLPSVVKDSARVWLYVYEAEASAEVDRELLLARRGKAWVVTGEGGWREALFERLPARRPPLH
jgi:hypothetical protein